MSVDHDGMVGAASGGGEGGQGAGAHFQAGPSRPGVKPSESPLLRLGTEAMAGIAKEFAELRAMMERVGDALDERSARRLQVIESQLNDFSAIVTVVGQVKAGKTSLINVIAGAPGLLPSDVNPWTSVVTTLHINKVAPKNTRAEFRFFDRGEWDRLVRGGGRLGEMAGRAGAAEELREIERQILEVRRKSQERLGRNFELLLGQRHSYDYLDTPLIERYVCLGDPDDPDMQANKQGRFADLTRSADLYIDLPQYPTALSLQDTPGVNDPFLMREQITLRVVRNTELCVVVLSANQALNTVDLALIRLLSTLEKRQVVIFVNRIDELERPSTQVAEIHESLISTLTRHGVGGTADIVFGSAKWAEAALNNRLDEMSRASIETLFDWAQAANIDRTDDPVSYAWKLSGIPTLVEAIGVRIAEGAAARVLEKARKQLRNIVAQSLASSMAGTIQFDGRASVLLSANEVKARTQALSRSLQAELDRETNAILADLKGRMKAANEAFVDSTVAAMIQHIQIYGPEGQWECDPMRLRMQLRVAYLNFARATRALAQSVLSRAAREVLGVYKDLLGEPAAELKLEAPLAPAVPPPVAIGKTIVVDLQASWWKRWLRARRGAEAFAGEYRALIAAETAAIVREIEEQQVTAVNEALRMALSEFLDDHSEALVEIARAGTVDSERLSAAVGERERIEKAAILQAALESLGGEEEAPKAARN
jgi:GTP-binding protein EngB required for normal cell division